jgi:Domain of unknown function (DUF4160)
LTDSSLDSALKGRDCAELPVQINPLGVLRGKFPPKALSLVIEWAQKYQNNLMEEWNRAANNKKLHKISPLD